MQRLLNNLQSRSLGALLQRAEGDPEDGLIRFVASTQKDASDGHIIVQAGWDLNLYRRNPIFLWSHTYDGICGGRSGAPYHPIGRSETMEVVDGDKPEARLVIGVRFDSSLDPATGHPWNPLAYLTEHQYRAGYLSMVSVGFRMIAKKPRSEYEESHPWRAPSGYVSLETRLYEVSAVPIGADAEAFQEGRQESAGTPALAEAARHFLETPEGRSILDGQVRDAILRIEEERAREGRGLFGLPLR